MVETFVVCVCRLVVLLNVKQLCVSEMPTLMAEIKNVLKRCADKQQLSTETSLVTSDLPFTGLQSPSMITTTPRRSPRKCQQPTSTPLAPSSNSDRVSNVYVGLCCKSKIVQYFFSAVSISRRGELNLFTAVICIYC